MTIRARLFRLRWQTYVALLTLAALVLPAISEAACLQADLSPRTATSLNLVAPVAPVVREAPLPMETPASLPRQATICQHGHCSHSQVGPETWVEVTPAFLVDGLLPRWIYDQMVDGDLIAGPDRPPQA